MANYSFTQPIRYYKANDPYYYEVDNIPLRQLEENVLYVKNIIEQAVGLSEGNTAEDTFLTPASEIDITNIKQLKPKAVGGRTIKVNAGKYTSRVNDAFDIKKPLTEIFKSTLISPNVVPSLTQSWTTTLRDQIWNSFIGATNSSNAYNINGLEFTYTFHKPLAGFGSGNTQETYNAKNETWPGFGVLADLTPMGDLGTSIDYSLSNLQKLHLAFVKKWRGIFRTSIVDFPESTIEIPALDNSDFYYKDADGKSVALTGDQRIDLLVAFSMTIDASSTTIQDYSVGFCTATQNPKKITQPILGIIRGAGVGIRKDDTGALASIEGVNGCTDAGTPGSARIMANRSDFEPDANYGITNSAGVKVHGSFPSPDDLLNLAPTLVLNAASDDLQLVGQTALPLAYIVVKRNQTNITSEDIIDIRPFLRTTELTYNERAGVAAANPPLSLANPAVGTFQLQQVTDYVKGISDSIQAQLGTTVESDLGVGTGRVLYTDYVMGGLAYGVEGTLLSMCDTPQGTLDPFGNTTQTTLYIDPISQEEYSFAPFTSSKTFLESTDLDLKKAFLQYVYNVRQSDLKRWLSDPNTLYNQKTGTYLGLPPGSTGRNIPLYPEWDPAIDLNNYSNTMLGEGGSTYKLPRASWWMWLEGVNRRRPLSYFPGGVVSTENSQSSYAYLSKQYGWGDPNKSGYIEAAMISVCTKRLEITLPSWCVDYDVFVEYVNCSPTTVGGAAAIGGEDLYNYPQTGLGGGLYVNKGPLVVTAGDKKKAIIQINSAASPIPMSLQTTETLFGKNGELNDTEDGFVKNGTQTYKLLSYSVALPQFRGTKYGTGTQKEAPDNTQRFVPKFGAAYYPTVKFSIVGHAVQNGSTNASYNANNNYTLLQNLSIGNSSNLLTEEGPIPTITSIDIS